MNVVIRNTREHILNGQEGMFVINDCATFTIKEGYGIYKGFVLKVTCGRCDWEFGLSEFTSSGFTSNPNYNNIYVCKRASDNVYDYITKCIEERKVIDVSRCGQIFDDTCRKITRRNQ